LPAACGHPIHERRDDGQRQKEAAQIGIERKVEQVEGQRRAEHRVAPWDLPGGRGAVVEGDVCGDVDRLLRDEGIVRHRGKIEAVINNARRAQELVKREGSLAAFIWRYEPDAKRLARPQAASTSAESLALSKELKKQGWKFVGPTTVYAFMQAMGLINDHVENCVIRAKVERARKSFRRPGR
jgi:hypothetical protein